jgi:solute carrier family 25 carnitine/acylcarnitine transporter 20/29
VKGLYRGQTVTLLRECSGYGTYFLAYEMLVQREIANKGIRRDQINPMNAVLYGAAAGYAVRLDNSFLNSQLTFRSYGRLYTPSI